MNRPVWPGHKSVNRCSCTANAAVQTQRTAQAVLCVGTAVYERDRRRPDASRKEDQVIGKIGKSVLFTKMEVGLIRST